MRCRSNLLARQQGRRIDPAEPEILRVSFRSSANSTGPSLNRIGGLACGDTLVSRLFPGCRRAPRPKKARD